MFVYMIHPPKVLGVDKICPEMLKNLDIVGLSWLARLSWPLRCCVDVGDSTRGVAYRGSTERFQWVLDSTVAPCLSNILL